ncbi:MAG: hypothetical protein QOG20_3577 [Pseudonocardiales bacterium]|nr:hypothetical protein [Pseudonocardiales bacterium]
MTDDATSTLHPAYGTCVGCQQLKHVTADGLVREHNRFEATGTVVSPSRCAGSGARSVEAGGPDPS